MVKFFNDLGTTCGLGFALLSVLGLGCVLERFANLTRRHIVPDGFTAEVVSLWRDGKFLANVTNEVHNGLPYRIARYEDLGLPTHSRHEYRIRKVWKDGRKDPLCESFYGLTRFTQANSNSHVRKE